MFGGQGGQGCGHVIALGHDRPISTGSARLGKHRRDEAFAGLADQHRISSGSFLDSCDNLDDTAFSTKQGQFSISLFESIFVATCIDAFKKKELVCSKVANDSVVALKENDDFINSNQGSVASKTNVKTRITKAIELLKFE